MVRVRVKGLGNSARAELNTRKRKLFLLMRQLKAPLFTRRSGAGNRAQRRAAWEEVFKRGRELGLAGSSRTSRQFRHGCVANTIRRTTVKLKKQLELHRESGVPEVVIDSLDEVVLDFIGRDSVIQDIAAQVNGGDCTRDPPSRDNTTVGEQKNQMVFAGTSAGTVDIGPDQAVAAADNSELRDELIVFDAPVAGRAESKGAVPVLDLAFSDDGDSPEPDLDLSSLPSSSAGGQPQTRASSVPQSRTCTMYGTLYRPRSTAVPSSNGPSLTISQGKSNGASSHSAQGSRHENTTQRRPGVADADGIDRRALAAEYRALLARPDEERTDEERAKVQRILTVRLLERMLGDSSSTSAELRRLAALILTTLV